MSIGDLGNVVGVSNVAEPRYEFDRATQIFREQSPDGSVAYSTKVHPGWDIMGNANGGYLLALVGHALTDATGRPDCITVSALYSAPCLSGDARTRAIPAPGPVACIFSTRFVQNGLLEEDGEMWDSNGILVAQSRQLALAPRQ